MAKAFIPHNKVMKSEKYGSPSYCEIQFTEFREMAMIHGWNLITFYCLLSVFKCIRYEACGLFGLILRNLSFPFWL